ncbi:hypothetical protein T459_11833 [Capsicum annuum]|uniref:Protein kinase domain-containing protein n=1 Tax=Capsicum annuum TaxID=4072 RepID=A0A2G2ZN20_CAPAN|nr:hypothetical protein T459_11833 [Capsicum annuum]
MPEFSSASAFTPRGRKDQGSKSFMSRLQNSGHRLRDCPHARQGNGDARPQAQATSAPAPVPFSTPTQGASSSTAGGPPQNRFYALPSYQGQKKSPDVVTGSRSTRAKSLHWTSCLKIAEDVAQGLTYIHQASKLTHGNLKSSNVLLGSDFEGMTVSAWKLYLNICSSHCSLFHQHLWLELSEGKTLLADSTPSVRTVEVMVVEVIGKDNKRIVESHQELSNGMVRHWCRPLSDKMRLGETVEDAIFRAVKEKNILFITKILLTVFTFAQEMNLYDQVVTSTILEGRLDHLFSRRTNDCWVYWFNTSEVDIR